MVKLKSDNTNVNLLAFQNLFYQGKRLTVFKDNCYTLVDPNTQSSPVVINANTTKTVNLQIGKRLGNEDFHFFMFGIKITYSGTITNTELEFNILYNKAKIFDDVNIGCLPKTGDVYQLDYYMGFPFKFNTTVQFNLTNNNSSNTCNMYFSLFGIDFKE